MAAGMTLWAIQDIADPKRGASSPAGVIVWAVIWWGLLALLYSPIVMRASFARAMKLAQEARLPGAAIAKIEEIYGKSAGKGFTVQPAAAQARPAPQAATRPASAAPRAAAAAPRPASRPASRPKPSSDAGAIPLELPTKPVSKPRPTQPPRR
jgi:hypothetical protein